MSTPGAIYFLEIVTSPDNLPLLLAGLTFGLCHLGLGDELLDVLQFTVCHLRFLSAREALGPQLVHVDDVGGSVSVCLALDPS